MSNLKGKHNIAEIEGVRCTVIETGVSEARAEFLTDLLTFNKYEVKKEKEKSKDGSPLETWVIGVTDILVSPVVLLYAKKLIRKDGKTVTPHFWAQNPLQDDIPYWMVQQ